MQTRPIKRWKYFMKPAMVLATLTMSSVLLGTDSYPRQNGIKIAHYTFDVTLSDETDEIVMKEKVDVDLLVGGIASIDLDLCGPRAKGAEPAQPGDPCVRQVAPGALSGQANVAATAGATGMTVNSVTEGNGPLKFSQRGDILRIWFQSPSRAGQSLTLTLHYSGVPATGLRIADNKYNDRSFVSNAWPHLARNWLATIDHISMKVPTTMIVTAPSKYQVISNGLLVQQVDFPNRMRRTTWKEKVPIPTWQISLAAAPYAVDYFGNYHGIQLSSWVFPQEREGGYKGFSQYTLPILEFFVDHIGPYSYEKLAHVQANTVGGGMELASNIFYGYTGVPDRLLIAHEMAHQWFGNSASQSDWDDVWLSEGFATYFALLYLEHQDGRDVFLTVLRNNAQKAMRFSLANPHSTIVHKNLSNISQVIANSAQVYLGGAQVLHMLRGVLGTDTFWHGIRLYYSRFQNKSASSEDFRRTMQEACVESPTCPLEARELEWFFRQWLNQGGILQVNGSWRYDAATKQLRIALEQTQTQGLYRMPIEIGIIMPPSPQALNGAQGDNATRPIPAPTPRILLDKQHNELLLTLDSEPLEVKLDPNVWVTMMQATFLKK